MPLLMPTLGGGTESVLVGLSLMDERAEALLARWQANAKRSQIANYDAAVYFASLNYWLGIPTAIASAVVGTSVFATLQENVEPWIRIVVGVISVAAAVLSSLQTFLRSEERASKHRAAAAEYGTVKREVDELLTLRDNVSGTIQERIAKVRERLDDLSRESPVVPDRTWQKAREAIPLAGAGDD